MIQWCPTCQSTRNLVEYTYEDTRQREHVCNVCGATIKIERLPKSTKNHQTSSAGWTAKAQ